MNVPLRPLAIVALAGLAMIAAAQPKILVGTNEMNRSEALGASRLKADGTWLVTYNSPDVEFSLWKSVCRQIGTGIFATEDGGISSNYLFNAQLTPQIMLRSATTGRYVSSPSASGAPLVADIGPDVRTPAEIFNLWSSQYGTWTPARPRLGQMPLNGAEVCLANAWGNWLSATGGGSSTLVPTATSPGPWERLRLYKKVVGDPPLRPGDPVALQTWNGFFTGGNYATVDPGSSRLVMNGGSLPQAETFTLTYPCEYVTGSQIAPVTDAMAYYEFADTNPVVHNHTMNNDEINEVARRTGSRNVVALARTFQNYSEYPGVLPTHRQQIVGILKNPNLRGVVFEMKAGADLRPGQILQGVDAIVAAGKKVYFLLPGGDKTATGAMQEPADRFATYTDAIRATLKQIKGTRNYAKITLVLSAYERTKTKITFLGGANSVEGALKWLKANR